MAGGLDMNTEVTLKQPSGNDEVTRGIQKRAIQLLVQFLLLAAILFLSSGRLDWWFAWVYLAIFVAGVAVNSLVLLRINPDLVSERAKQVTSETKRWDKILATIWGLMTGIVSLLVAGLDLRFGWSPQIPLTVQLSALLFHMFGSAFASWALVSNAFFASTVHIQADRGHTVASSGPYRLVRHPGYAGWMVSSIAVVFMLGSLWALIPAAVAVLALIARTALEDRTLHQELPGYEEYAQRVRYRLAPGIW
jgi:protein-S-isoprenylcysteine O-methyltransferase Ste14